MAKTTQQADEPDQYAKLCRAMEEGLLITVNNDESAQGAPSDELRVESGGYKVLLRDAGGDLYLLRQTDNGDTVLSELTTDGIGRETYVETIEILGIDTPN